MRTADTALLSKVTPETVARMATELVGTRVAEKERKAAADMLQAILTEMTALRRMDVGSAEPAFTFEAGEFTS
jgi:hypothetical protein